jgi:hypothetical protein
MRKEQCIGIGFALVLAVGVGAQIISPDAEVSESERRTLTRFPVPEKETVLSGAYFDTFEDYLLDQFPGRDAFRSAAGIIKQKIFGQKDVDGIYQVGDGIYKLEYPLSESNILRAAEGFTKLCQDYFADSNCYYAIIPDKNYFVAEENGYPALDYDLLENLMQEYMTDASYIRIFDLLELSDYYRLDLHWKQECIFDVSEALLSGMDEHYQSQSTYKAVLTDDAFYGAYYHQAAVAYLKPDTLVCFSSPQMEQFTVFDYEKNRELPVYAEDALEGLDHYDVYLSGAKALLEITNPSGAQDKTLYLFRDSFGSSIAPLLAENYSRIVLVDLRYITPAALMQIMGTPDEGSDVLFLYNTMILNQSLMLKLT